MSEISVRRATSADLCEILKIYAAAREYMRASGNPSQWGTSYPPRELLSSDISEEKLFVASDGEDILAVFYFDKGPDATYDKIYDGFWQGSESYSVIHRIAVSPKARGRGVAKLCFDWCLNVAGEIRIDTHRDNIPMQRALLKNGFSYCGVIRIERPSAPTDDCCRLAYHKSLFAPSVE